MDCKWKRALIKGKVNSETSPSSLINGSQQNMLSFVTLYLSLKQFLLFAEWLKFLFLGNLGSLPFIMWNDLKKKKSSSKSLLKWVSL